MKSARPQSFPFSLLPLPFAALGVLAACSGPTNVEFGPPRVLTKEQRPTVWGADQDTRLGIDAMRAAAQSSAQGPGAQGQGGGKVWVGDTPAGWEVGKPSQFRDAVWKIAGQPDTEAWLTASPTGAVGMNLERWYTQQFGLADVPKLEALPVAELAGKPGRLAEIKGAFRGRAGEPKPGWATLILFTTEGGVVTSSFVLRGPEKVVLGKKDEFLALAKSLRSATASPNAGAPPIEPGAKMPENHPPVPGVGTDPHGAAGKPPAPAAKAPFTATTPAGWTPKSGKPLHHTFGKDGEVYVSQLGGTLKSSLDIWRGEMGQQTPITDEQVAALPKIAFLGEDAVLLDLSGDMNGMVRQLPGARMLLAARIDGGTITFCKLVGTAADVATQVDAFRTFCGSVRRAQ
jgi:hypothetical protein